MFRVNSTLSLYKSNRDHIYSLGNMYTIRVDLKMNSFTVWAENISLSHDWHQPMFFFFNKDISDLLLSSGHKASFE